MQFRVLLSHLSECRFKYPLKILFITPGCLSDQITLRWEYWESHSPHKTLVTVLLVIKCIKSLYKFLRRQVISRSIATVIFVRLPQFGRASNHSYFPLTSIALRDGSSECENLNFLRNLQLKDLFFTRLKCTQFCFIL